jgi:putative SOS response-associated peptidase YedK
VCGRFAQQRPASELAEIFGADPLAEELGPRFNVAPTDEAFVVVQREDRRAVTAYRWGLIPHWADSARVGSRMFNARAETLTSSPAFRDALQRRRCLVPVDAFYEWKHEGGTRQPFAIGRVDGSPLVLAGLWAGWRDPTLTGADGSPVVRRTFTIVTTTPNAVMVPLHDRMPVVVPDSAWDAWLDVRVRDDGELLAILQPRDEPALASWPVSRLVNDVRNDGPALIEPIVA